MSWEELLTILIDKHDDDATDGYVSADLLRTSLRQNQDCAPP